MTDRVGREVHSTSPFSALRFDPDAYRQFIENHELSDEEATELLGAIWSIVVCFVDGGFPIPGTSEVVDGFPREGCNDPPAALSCKDQFQCNSNDITAPDAIASRAVSEDS